MVVIGSILLASQLWVEHLFEVYAIAAGVVYATHLLAVLYVSSGNRSERIGK